MRLSAADRIDGDRGLPLTVLRAEEIAAAEVRAAEREQHARRRRESRADVPSLLLEIAEPFFERHDCRLASPLPAALDDAAQFVIRHPAADRLPGTHESREGRSARIASMAPCTRWRSHSRIARWLQVHTPVWSWIMRDGEQRVLSMALVNACVAKSKCSAAMCSWPVR